jgi:hypothetical protein
MMETILGIGVVVALLGILWIAGTKGEPAQTGTGLQQGGGEIDDSCTFPLCMAGNWEPITGRYQDAPNGHERIGERDYVVEIAREASSNAREYRRDGKPEYAPEWPAAPIKVGNWPVRREEEELR